ncbi:MAG: diguanylate phosphodiesterase [Bryobacterales bacterium]|nr:diguanylate phosphodiesterase [Bryobacterales bacterium]
MLLWLGCDEAQGWLYGAPAPARELAAIVAVQPGRPASPSFRWKNLSVGNLEGLPSQRLAQLQAVYDGAPVALGFLDRSFKYVNLNRRLADLNHLPLEEHWQNRLRGRARCLRSNRTVPEPRPQRRSGRRRGDQGVRARRNLSCLVPARPRRGGRSCRHLLGYQTPEQFEATSIKPVQTNCRLVIFAHFTARKVPFIASEVPSCGSRPLTIQTSGEREIAPKTRHLCVALVPGRLPSLQTAPSSFHCFGG